MVELDNFDYLLKYQILTIEDLVGRSVFFVYATQGIRKEEIRKIEYTKKSREWFFVCRSSYRVSELGASIFFSEDEAMIYQQSKFHEYTQQQQERTLRANREKRERELKELERLLAKYPDEESRKREVKNCSTCKNNVEYPPPHTCDICTSLDQEEEYEMWEEKGY